MPVSTLVATAGAANANSYVTLAVADQYHDDRPQSTTWNLSTTSRSDKTKSLLWATKLLEGMVEWWGAPSDTTQVLKWPRSGLVDRNKNALDETAIPNEIQWATAELANWLLAEDRAADNEVEAQQLTMLRAGPITLEFDSSSAYNKIIPDSVYHLIPREWWHTFRGRRVGFRRTVR